MTGPEQLCEHFDHPDLLLLMCLLVAQGFARVRRVVVGNQVSETRCVCLDRRATGCAFDESSRVDAKHVFNGFGRIRALIARGCFHESSHRRQT
jgi:hypothetical protein